MKTNVYTVHIVQILSNYILLVVDISRILYMEVVHDIYKYIDVNYTYVYHIGLQFGQQRSDVSLEFGH